MKVGSVSWIYQARRVATQANAAGGAQKIDISIASGQLARVISAKCLNSGTNGISIFLADEDNANHCGLSTIGSGAGTYISLPAAPGSNTSSTANADAKGMLLAAGQKLSFEQTGAGAQNDTFTIAITLELFNKMDAPTWDKSRSTNAADVTLAASTISAANTLTTGRIWT